LWLFPALSAVIAGAALSSSIGQKVHVMADVQSGSPGFRTTPSGKPVHWTKGAVTVYLDPSLKRMGPSADEAVMQAFGEWIGSDPRLPSLSFDSGKTSATPRQDGMSTVSYAPITVPGHEHDVAITVTYSNSQTGEILEADMVLNASYPMGTLTPKPAKSTGNANGANRGEQEDNAGKAGSGNEESLDCNNRYDTQDVATHEAGHFFGLGEDMTERQATMFFSIGHCETHKRVLAPTDVSAVATLYAQSAPLAKTADREDSAAQTQPGARGCSFGGAPDGGSPLWLSAAALLGSVLWRRRREA
jgi:MYXO-CTERM domain-containing protein